MVLEIWPETPNRSSGWLSVGQSHRLRDGVLYSERPIAFLQSPVKWFYLVGNRQNGTKITCKWGRISTCYFYLFICNLFYFHSRAATQGTMEGYSSTGSSFILFRTQKTAWGLFIFAFLGYVISGTKTLSFDSESRNNLCWLNPLVVVAGQSCEPYVVTGQSKCDTFLANQFVYISGGQTQASIQQLIYPDVYPLGVFVPQSCRSTGIQLACAFNLPPCNISTINNKTTIGKRFFPSPRLYPFRALSPFPSRQAVHRG